MGVEIDKMYIELPSFILLSVQRALLDEIDPNLRAVKIDWDEENSIIHLHFYYDNKITDENNESASCVAGEVAGDFSLNTRVLEHCIHLDFPNELPDHKLVAYRRKEIFSGNKK